VKDSTSFSPFSFQNGRLQRNLSFQKRLPGRWQKGCQGVCNKLALAFAKRLSVESLQKGPEEILSM
jgi:hypothetical protein